MDEIEFMHKAEGQCSCGKTVQWYVQDEENEWVPMSSAWPVSGRCILRTRTGREVACEKIGKFTPDRVLPILTVISQKPTTS